MEGVSEKWLDWDYILKVKLMISADTLDIGCERKAKVIDYSNFGLSNWVNYGAIY